MYCLGGGKPPVLTVSTALFGDCILRAQLDSETRQDATVHELVRDVILHQIWMERNGDMADRQLIRACIQILLGLEDSIEAAEEHVLYLSSFEEDFLRSSRDFYRTEGEVWMRESTAASFRRHTKRRISEDRDLCQALLSMSSTQKLLRVADEELPSAREPSQRMGLEQHPGVSYWTDVGSPLFTDSRGDRT